MIAEPLAVMEILKKASLHHFSFFWFGHRGENRTKESIMTNEKPTKAKPSHRVSFSRIIGNNDDGSDKLGPAREIGAVWERRSDKKGGILQLDHIPVELTRHEGVIFIVPVE